MGVNWDRSVRRGEEGDFGSFCITGDESVSLASSWEGQG